MLLGRLSYWRCIIQKRIFAWFEVSSYCFYSFCPSQLLSLLLYGLFLTIFARSTLNKVWILPLRINILTSYLSLHILRYKCIVIKRVNNADYLIFMILYLQLLFLTSSTLYSPIFLMEKTNPRPLIKRAIFLHYIMISIASHV